MWSAAYNSYMNSSKWGCEIPYAGRSSRANNLKKDYFCEKLNIRIWGRFKVTTFLCGGEGSLIQKKFVAVEYLGRTYKFYLKYCFD
jgi:hypothetical protein